MPAGTEFVVLGAVWPESCCIECLSVVWPILCADEMLGVERPRWSVLRPFLVVSGLVPVQGCTKGVSGTAFGACKHS